MVDKDKIKQSVTLFLEAIGEDPNRNGLLDTPDRVARMCEEIFSGIGADAKDHLSRVFDAEASGLIVEKDIQFYSVCEHHLLPFFGKVHIAYEHGEKVVGISKLARTVEVYARRPQIQENMTTQIAQAIMDELKPYGVMVVVEAEHMCMSMRGVKNESARTVTMATLGSFDNNEKLKEEALRLIRF